MKLGLSLLGLLAVLVLCLSAAATPPQKALISGVPRYYQLENWGHL